MVHWRDQRSDPAAQRGLYNVFVYVPNRPLDPIPTGPVCTACQAPASGKPLVSAVTDAKGKFTIKNAPAGANIPLVMQQGKWRRRINIPMVTQCTANTLSDKNQTRMPKKQTEGNADSNIPQIAYFKTVFRGAKRSKAAVIPAAASASGAAQARY